MFDYYSHVYTMSEDKLSQEIEKLNKRLIKTDSGSPIYNQLLSMLELAESAYQESIIKKSIKSESTVINIGDIESTVTEPDYSQQDLLIALVQEYTSDPGNKKQ